MAPQLRNLLQRKVVTHISTGVALGLAAGLAWKFGYAEPKRAKYTEFYKNYDADKEAKLLEARIAAAGKA